MPSSCTPPWARLGSWASPGAWAEHAGAADTASAAAMAGAGIGQRRHFRFAGPFTSSDLRASDAERSEVADRLARHYADGRLDQAEFGERLDKAMSAKTRSDLDGLFDDLPDLPGDPAQPGRPGQPGRPEAWTGGRPRRRRGLGLRRLLVLALAVAGALVVAHALSHSFIPWLLAGLVAFLWLRDRSRRSRRSG